MKKKNSKTKNGKQGMPFNKKIKLSQQMVKGKEVYDLRIMKTKKNKDEVCEATKPPQRNLRTRTVKNYSEKSKVVDSKPEVKEVNKESPAIENGKERIPIYRSIKLFEEKIKNQEEIYEFVDDLQVSDGKVKKLKKSVKKTAVKRAKKGTVLQHNRSRKEKTKPIETVSKNVQLKEQKKQSIIETEQHIKHSVYTNIKIPEHLQNAGDNTITEASTITIADEMLQESDKASPKNTATFQLNIQDSNMSNHSLIKQSTSPITKEVDNLSIGSPKRPINAFSRVQNLVQSTPQVNILLAEREKHPPEKMNLDKKSICSEDTIHLSSIANEKLTNQKPTKTQKENVSPRKFETVISNLNPIETTTTSSIKQASLQDKQQSPQKEVLSSTCFKNNLEIQDNISSMSSILTADNEDNNTLNSNKSPKMKIKTPSSFRIDKIRSHKQIASSESKSDAENSNSQKENKNPDVTAGPSDSEKLKTVVLRQSNLNNFLNLDELPQSTRISTIHGIFNDANNSPINGKKPQTIFEESNIENAFGFENCIYSERFSPIKKTSTPIIATARDVARSIKGKLFLKARVKSALTRRIAENTIKKTLLKNIFKKNVPESKAPIHEEIPKENDVAGNEKSKSLMDTENGNNKSLVDTENEKNTNLTDTENEKSMSLIDVENEKNMSLMDDENEKNASLINYESEKSASLMDVENENISLMDDENEKNTSFMDAENENTSLQDEENINISLDPKKAFLDAISFSDTFDFLCESGEDVSSKMPDEIPLFIDLEPVHFSQPPRRSYTKMKKATCFNTSRSDSEKESFEEDDNDKPKKKKKKVSRLSKEEQKKMQQWVKSVNEKFNEIEQFNLTVE